MKEQERGFYQIIMVLLGVFLIGLGYGIMYHLHWGSLPTTTLIEGVSHLVNSNFILSGWIVNIIFMLPLILLHKRLLGIGTILFALFLGVAMEIGVLIIVPLNIEMISIWTRLVLLLISCVIIGAGLGITLSLDVGVLPAESFSLIFSEKFDISFTVGILMQDIISLAIGILLGASWGIGTLVVVITTNFFMKQWIHLMNTSVHNKLNYKNYS